jgi:hypothetical protein
MTLSGPRGPDSVLGELVVSTFATPLNLVRPVETALLRRALNQVHDL